MSKSSGSGKAVNEVKEGAERESIGKVEKETKEKVDREAKVKGYKEANMKAVRKAEVKEKDLSGNVEDRGIKNILTMKNLRN